MYENGHHPSVVQSQDYHPPPPGDTWFWGSYGKKPPTGEESLLEEEDEANSSSCDEGYDTGTSPQSAPPEEKDKREDEGNPNLMWLLDFKLDFFNDQPPVPHPESALNNNNDPKESDKAKEDDDEPSASEEEPRPTEISPPSKIYEKTSKKPPYTYTELITQALKDKTALTVSGIYQWIMDRYLFFKAEDDRWKNSVRHNLSMNPHFRKGTKSKHGAGHLWVLADYEEEASCLGSEALEPMGLSPIGLEEDEAAKAVKSILDSEEQKLAAASESNQSSSFPPVQTSEQSSKRGKRKRGYPGSPEAFSPPSQPAFQKQETSPLMQSDSYVVQEVTTHGQEVFIAETTTTSLLESGGSKRLFLELRPDTTPVLPPPPSSDIPLHENPSSYPSSLGLTSVASNVEISTQHIPFSPMEDMEELGVAGYCYEEDVTSLENALGFDFHQKQLLAK